MTISHPAPPQICDLARFSSRRSPAKTQEPIQQQQKSIRVISRALPILVSLLAPTRTSDVSISVCLVVWCRVLSFLILIVLWVSPCKADLPFRRWHLSFGFTFLQHTAYRIHHHCTYIHHCSFFFVTACLSVWSPRFRLSSKPQSHLTATLSSEHPSYFYLLFSPHRAREDGISALRVSLTWTVN